MGVPWGPLHIHPFFYLCSSLASDRPDLARFCLCLTNPLCSHQPVLRSNL